ncbi:PTS transporter subunit EIIB [Jeotgalibaca arthritidis]|uniref:PTS transporter subunit EIIB n=1 Tax=Jeotgalibaca arthritidis TaxID=1868794 RepID=A0A6G7K8A5_9LACT|nr:PTS transporter subunit EIIB [Jeotgalibaca arthritidis]QII81472.1 PTS transporter subunit EIIB [Jeotgalibaca arthritidis]
MSIKKKDYKSLATDIIDFVGGEENINRVIHCITRLRYYLKDETILEKEKLEHLDGVIGIVEANSQFQVVVVQAVDDIYDEVIAGVFRINMWNIIGSIIELPSYIDPVNGITSYFLVCCFGYRCDTCFGVYSYLHLGL